MADIPKEVQDLLDKGDLYRFAEKIKEGFLPEPTDHERNKDQYMDKGGASETTVADIKDAVTKRQSKKTTFGITLDSGGNPIGVTGYQNCVVIPYVAVITKWHIIGDVVGSAVMDLKRNGTSIIGTGNKPTLSSAQKNSEVPSGWTSVAIAENDEIDFYLDSSSSLSKITLVVTIDKS
jgi:hypothetical protein